MIISSIILSEILIAEFLSIWLLSKKKHKFIWCILLYGLITGIMFAFLFLFAKNTKGFGNGSGILMYAGILYFIPALVNYGGNIRRRLIIAFYSFSYGLLCYCLAVRVTYCFMDSTNTNFLLIVLITLSLIYLLSYPVFYYYSKNKVIKYLDLASSKIANIFIQYTIASFFLLLSVNIHLTTNTSAIRKLLVYAVLIYLIILTYKLSILYSKETNLKNLLYEEVGKDSLTQLENRYSFEKKFEVWLKDENVFYLFYIDLDKFKSINDNYGHNVGDKYLQNFASTLNNLGAENTFVYRLAGDEFVVITKNIDLNIKMKNMKVEPINGIEFLGFSFGYASFPEDGLDMESLLRLADKNMYIIKNSKKVE